MILIGNIKRTRKDHEDCDDHNWRGTVWMNNSYGPKRRTVKRDLYNLSHMVYLNPFKTRTKQANQTNRPMIRSFEMIGPTTRFGLGYHNWSGTVWMNDSYGPKRRTMKRDLYNLSQIVYLNPFKTRTKQANQTNWSMIRSFEMIGHPYYQTPIQGSQTN